MPTAAERRPQHGGHAERRCKRWRSLPAPGPELGVGSPVTPLPADPLLGAAIGSLAADELIGREVLDYVASLRDEGVTSVVISHNLHRIHPIADRIVAMARGEKIADLRKTDISIEGLTDLIG
jgi:hypothetical protein